MSDEIGTIINALIATHAGVPVETLDDPEMRLDSLTMDSLGVIELMFDIEEKYDVHIEDPMQLKDLNIGQLHTLVAELIASGGAKAITAVEPAVSVDVAQV